MKVVLKQKRCVVEQMIDLNSTDTDNSECENKHHKWPIEYLFGVGNVNLRDGIFRKTVLAIKSWKRWA